MAIPRSRWTQFDPRFTLDTQAKRDLFIHHTVTRLAKPWTRDREEAHMRFIEQLHLDRRFTGIGYSFVLFPSGRLYVGRGPQPIPAAQLGANSGTIAIAFVGDFRTDQPTDSAIHRLDDAITALKLKRGIRRIGGHQDAPNQSTECPGSHLEARIDNIAHRNGLAVI